MYRDQNIVVTTVNNDSIAGRATWTTRHELTLERAELLGPGEPTPMAGVITINTHAIAWIQIHRLKREE